MSEQPVLQVVRDLPSAEQNAAAGGPRGGARSAPVSVTKTAPRRPPQQPPATPRGRLADWAGRQAKAAGSVTSGTSVFRAQSPSVHAVWLTHSEAGDRYVGSLWRTGRKAYGVIHVAGTAIAYALIWFTSSPVMTLLLAALIVVVIWAR